MAILNLNIPYVLGMFSSLALLVTKRRGSGIIFATFFSFYSFAGVITNLQKKFPDCEIKTKSYFLSEKDKEFLRSKFPDRTIEKYYSYYLKKCKNDFSRLYVLNDLVRTHKQYILLENQSNTLKKIEVLRFNEPKEYIAPNIWYQIFKGRSLKNIENVDSISGATLTVRSTKFLSFLALYLDVKMTQDGK